MHIMCTKAMCFLPFCDHRENINATGPESGNFLKIIDLLSRYDSILKTHIINGRSRFKYLYHEIQNKINSLLQKSVRRFIFDIISTAPF